MCVSSFFRSVTMEDASISCLLKQLACPCPKWQTCTYHHLQRSLIISCLCNRQKCKENTILRNYEKYHKNAFMGWGGKVGASIKSKCTKTADLMINDAHKTCYLNVTENISYVCSAIGETVTFLTLMHETKQKFQISIMFIICF